MHGEWTRTRRSHDARKHTTRIREGDGTSHLKPTDVSMLHEAEAGGEDRIPTKEEIGEGGGGVRGQALGTVIPHPERPSVPADDAEVPARLSFPLTAARRMFNH